MRFRFLVIFAAGSILALGATVFAQTGTGSPTGQGAEPGQRRRGGGFFAGPGGGRGILGAVTEVTADHYTLKTDSGELYTVHYSVNTRIMKQPPGGRRGRGPGAGSGNSDRPTGESRDPEAEMERQQPQPIKPSEIKVGDFVTAGGEVDAAAKSIGAVFIFLLDPESARQMRELQANYGKTWLAGRITSMDGTRITIEGAADHTPHAIEVDENTSFRKRRESITMADMQVGDQIRTEGTPQGGVFRAKTLNDMGVYQPEGAAPAGAQPK